MKNIISNKIAPVLLTLFMLTIMFLSVGCKKSSDEPGPNEVYIQGMSFVPSTITVKANTTITWTNKDVVEHTVTSNDGLFDSGVININATFSHTFDSAGTFLYSCLIHPDMTGSVAVN